MAPPLLHLQDIRLALGSAPLLLGAELSVAPGERICLVGRNGSGKSTLLRVAAGALAADAGRRFLQPGTTLHYLPQDPDLAGFPTVDAYLEAGRAPGEDAHRALAVLDRLGLRPDADPATLSGGETRRAALARALGADPDILLLDEPTNHLDLPAIAWLETALEQFRGAVVLISHDRRLLTALSRAIVWLDRGVTRRVERGFAHFEAWRDEVLEQEERDAHKLERKLAMEEDWLRYGVTARRKRNVRRLADLHELRARTRAHAGPQSTARLEAADAATSGKLVAVAEGVGKAFGANHVVRGLDLRVQRGDRLGIIGPNGAGKTTLLNLLTGRLAPDAGRITIGAALTTVFLDQKRDSLDPATTLADTLTGGRGDQVLVNGVRRHVIGYMKDFLFTPAQARTPVGTLSGGERGRLALAVALAQPANLLVLDEPTNDLDLETLDLLQELLADHPGTILLVSHDRDFLDRVCTSVLAAEGDGRWVAYAGGYTDMLAQRGEAAVVPAAKPARPPEGRAAEPRRDARVTRLSFKDRAELEALPKRMEDLQSAIAELTRRLADPDLYARNRPAFDRMTSDLARAEEALARAEERWLELEIQRADLQAG